jgi:hypothetical protein
MMNLEDGTGNDVLYSHLDYTAAVYRGLGTRRFRQALCNCGYGAEEGIYN